MGHLADRYLGLRLSEEERTERSSLLPFIRVRDKCRNYRSVCDSQPGETG